MANATLPHINFTRNDLTAAADAAKDKVNHDPRWVRVIDRAVDHLSTGQFIYDGHIVTLRSASRRERVYRIAVKEPMACTCEGRERGYTCWHIVAARLVVRAAEVNASKSVYYKGFWYTPEQLDAARQARIAAGYEEAQRLADEIFA